MLSFLGSSSFSFRHARRANKHRKARTSRPTASSASINNQQIITKNTETSAEATSNAAADSAESAGPVTTPTALHEASLCCVEQNLFRSHLPLAYTIAPEPSSSALEPVDSTDSTVSTDSTASTDSAASLMHSPDVVPILHPNEVLLQRFPQKTSMKRVSPLRLASLESSTSSTPEPTPSSQPVQASQTGRRFRSGSLIDHFSRNSARGTDTQPSQASTPPTFTPTTTTTTTTTPDLPPHATFTTCNGSTPCAADSADSALAETAHAYLTKDARPGTLYVTSERLLFLPTDSDDTTASSNSSGFDVVIAGMDTMRVVESDAGAWFFVCYEGPHLTTLPFKTKTRARSFLKLMSNIRFEQKVRESLPPMYTSQGEGECCQRGGSLAQCRTCAETAMRDWAAEDLKLPSYAESEEAVRQYLIRLGLMPATGVFDRQSGELDVLSMLAQACAPPEGGVPATPQQSQQSQQGRRASAPAAGSRRRAASTTHNTAANASGSGSGNAMGYHPDERIYGVPLVWI